MGFVRPFLLSAIVLARRQGSGPFVGRAREAEEGEEHCEKLNGLDRAALASNCATSTSLSYSLNLFWMICITQCPYYLSAA